jgi:hypothetical protein
MVLEVSRSQHLRGHINHGGIHGAQYLRLKSLSVIDAILQAEYDGIGPHERRHHDRRFLGIVRLDAAKDQGCPLDVADVRASPDRNVCSKTYRVHEQSMLTNGLYVLRAPDQHDLMARAGQHATVIASYRPCTHDSDSHA